MSRDLVRILVNGAMGDADGTGVVVRAVVLEGRPKSAVARDPVRRPRPGHYQTKIDHNRKARNHNRQLEALGYTVALTQAA
jgi:hypothetical protein